MRLDRIRALIAVGASIFANCQPCLQATTAIALESGADAREITDAIKLERGSDKARPPRRTSSPRVWTMLASQPPLQRMVGVSVARRAPLNGRIQHA